MYLSKPWSREEGPASPYNPKHPPPLWLVVAESQNTHSRPYSFNTTFWGSPHLRKANKADYLTLPWGGRASSPLLSTAIICIGKFFAFSIDDTLCRNQTTPSSSSGLYFHDPFSQLQNIPVKRLGPYISLAWKLLGKEVWINHIEKPSKLASSLFYLDSQ